MSDEEKNALRVNCPKCGARTGWRCITPSRERLSKSHAERRRIGSLAAEREKLALAVGQGGDQP